jgi:hypothetical protein
MADASGKFLLYNVGATIGRKEPMTMKTSKQWILLVVVFLVGIAVGAGITWAVGVFSGPQFKIVEGYTTNVDLDGEAIGLAEQPGGPGVGYQIAGAWWREQDGPWHTHGPTCLEPLTSGQKVRLGVVHFKTSEAPRGNAVVWLECVGRVASNGSIAVEGVQVTAGERIIVHGRSTLPNGTCLGTELWADGELQTWWPGDTCVPVQDGAWRLSVPLGQDGAPAGLDASAQYMVRAYQQNGPNIVSVFPFDLTGPPTPNP